MSAPRRFKTHEEMSPDEWSQRHQAQRRGEAEPRFETDDYKAARAKALAAAGLHDEEDR